MAPVATVVLMRLVAVLAVMLAMMMAGGAYAGGGGGAGILKHNCMARLWLTHVMPCPSIGKAFAAEASPAA